MFKISSAYIFLVLSATGLISIRIVTQLNDYSVPIVINTWPFINATIKAWNILQDEKMTAIDAVEFGCSVCEREQCDGTVGYGGSPDESGETTLDAMIMDGTKHDVGAVGDLRRIKEAISVARKLMEHSRHTFLVGDQATNFAKDMGFKEVSLTTNASSKIYDKWIENNCQPNFWVDVYPDARYNCGPYRPSLLHTLTNNDKLFSSQNHDTIGMIAIDSNGKIAGGTSTNGARHKIPGRVGDSPIPGSGAYVDREVGGAAATGDGDVMMRFMPSLLTVEKMRLGKQPQVAAEEALAQIARLYPKFVGAIVATNIEGHYAAACHGLKNFTYSVANPTLGKATLKTVDCIG